MINDIREIFNVLCVEERYKEDFNIYINEINDIRNKTFSIVYLAIYCIIIVTFLFNTKIDIYKVIIKSSIWMIILCIIFIYSLYKLKGNLKHNIHFIMLLLISISSILFIYQDNYELSIVYGATIIFLSVMYLQPKRIIISNIISQLVFIISTLYTINNNEQMIINILSLSVLVLIACLINIKLYNNEVNHFLKNTVIKNKNIELKHSIDNIKIEQAKLKRITELKDSMLEVAQSIVGIEDIKILYNLILQKALDSVDTASIGSILIVNEDRRLIIAAHKGYDWNKTKKFNISLEESFLWLKSKGKLNKTVVINDISSLDNVNVIDVSKDNDKWNIGSTISAPIIVDGEFYGMLNIDSKDKHAFTEEDRKVIEYLRTQIEIALGRHLLYQQIINLSRYDKRSSVHNRSYFEELFRQQIKEAKRYKKTLSVILFDLNRLKNINDNYGHLAGDESIKKFASALKSSFRESDLVARYGGDEFIVVLLNADLINIEKKINCINYKLKQSPLVLEDESIICTFSYGTASYPYDADNYKDLVRIADERMYKHKAIFREVNSN